MLPTPGQLDDSSGQQVVLSGRPYRRRPGDAASGKLQKAVVVFAADHAVDGGENKTNGKNSKADALEIATGRGPINKVAHRIGAGVMLLDMGLEEDIPESQGVQDLKVMHGSHFGPARMP